MVLVGSSRISGKNKIEHIDNKQGIREKTADKNKAKTFE